MPKKIHEVNMHAQDFQETKQNKKKYQVKIGYQMEKSSLGRYLLEDTSRNEISIDTRKRKDIGLPKERMVPNKPTHLQSFMMAQSTKKKRLAFHQHTLEMDHKMSVLSKIG